ncbi:MAG: polysaccharide biosynthesis protein [Chloroflexi bacterium]|nr:MAG: polysaccharide biosynthesis protein [Chloroflexota bacterium]
MPTGLPAIVLGGALCVWGTLCFLAMVVVVRRTAVPAGANDRDAALRILRNAAVPIVSQLFVRGVDLAVALVLLRLLGPEGNGQYAVAVVAWLYVKTISDFGLSVLGAREIARDPSQAGRTIGETTVVRWIILFATAAPLGALTLAGVVGGTLSSTSAAALCLLYVSIIPSSYAEAVSSAFAGLERLALAAWVNIVVNLFRAPLVIALAASSLAVIGVALAAVGAACYSACAFHVARKRLIAGPTTWHLPKQRLSWYLREGWPLLVNSLLVSLFFRVDVFIVQVLRGDTALGIYDAAFKFINLLTIVPAYAILAVFPLMVRRSDDPAGLRAAQTRTTYLLTTVAWAVVVGATALASPAILLLAGRAYMPDAVELLRILVWFAPLSFVNGVTQYVLIARGEQRRLLPAFAAAVAFNFAANAALVPVLGATAAAINTVLTEVVIAVAFWLATRRTVFPAFSGAVLTPLWKPSLAGTMSAAAALYLRDSTLLSAGVGGGMFLLLCWLFGVVGPGERELARTVLRRRAGA